MKGNEERVAEALESFGLSATPEFWRRYYTDAWTFSLANAVERLTAQLRGTP